MLDCYTLKVELLRYSETLVTISLYKVTRTKTSISIIAAAINSNPAIIIAFTVHFLPDNFSRLLDRYTVAMFISSLILHSYFLSCRNQWQSWAHFPFSCSVLWRKNSSRIAYNFSTLLFRPNNLFFFFQFYICVHTI